MKVLETTSACMARAMHIQGGAARDVEDRLVVEGALQIVVNGEPYSVTMRTPGEDAELALGLLYAEKVFGALENVVEVKEAAECDGAATVSLTINRAKTTQGARRLASNASCGVCGLVSADSLLETMEGRMRSAQALFQCTGGCHGAALFNLSGELLVLREDVGRHNAVDKAVGALLRAGRLDEAALLFTSGRVSYEIVAKAARAGIRFLLAVSAPSSLAVDMSREAGITLVAFCRGGKGTVYTHPGQVTGFAADEDLNAEAAEAKA
jgi:FdhD protein